MLIIGRDDLRRAVPMDQAIELMRSAPPLVLAQPGRNAADDHAQDDKDEGQREHKHGIMCGVFHVRASSKFTDASGKDANPVPDRIS